MNKSELIRKIKAYTDKPFITKKQLAECMSFESTRSVDKYFVGLTRFGNRFLVDDVVQKMLEYSK